MSRYKNDSDEIKSLFSKLTDKLESYSLEKSIHQECLGFVKEARRAAKNGETEAAVDQIDLFILCLKRNLCTQLSLQHAADLFEIAVADIKPRFGQPGQIFAEAQPKSSRRLLIYPSNRWMGINQCSHRVEKNGPHRHFRQTSD